MQFFYFQEVKAVAPDIIVKLIAGSHSSQFRPRNASQRMKVKVVDPMQNHPSPKEEAEYPRGRDVPDIAEVAKLRHDKMWYPSVVEQRVCKRETKDKCHPWTEYGSYLKDGWGSEGVVSR
jgi:hypothetical protein